MRSRTIKTNIKARLKPLAKVALALLSLVASGLTMADNQGCHHGQAAYNHLVGEKGGIRVAQLAKGLDLTDAQQSAINAVITSQQASESKNRQTISRQLLELAQLASGSDAYIVKAKAIGAMQGEAMAQSLIESARLDVQILDLLTAEQARQYQQMLDEMAYKGSEHRQKHAKKDNRST